MTPEERIQPFIVACHRRTLGLPPLEIPADQVAAARAAPTRSDAPADVPHLTEEGGAQFDVTMDAPAAVNGAAPAAAATVVAADDPAALFRDQPDLLAYAQAEVKRLRESGRRGSLAESDYESKIRCVALERMIQVYGESGNE